jgi:hypothetical protein
MPQLPPATIEALLVELDGASLSESLIDELRSLHERQVVRLIDVIVVKRDTGGQVKAYGRTELSTEEAARLQRAVSDALGFRVGSQEFGSGLHWHGLSVMLGAEDVRFIADSLPPGRAALAVVFEHTWATRLGRLMHGHGVKLIEDDVFSPEQLSRGGQGISLW